jgi:RNA 3'-terminal phosphate cyclase
MALNRGKLSDVHRVGAGTSVGIVTVTSDKKIYVKSIICHAAGTGIATASAQVYYCPSGITSGPTNKIFDVDVAAGETVLLEPSYPIVLESTGDQLVVGTGNVTGLAATHVNFMVTGDKEV